MWSHLRFVRWLVGCLSLMAAASDCVAREPFVEFLRGLQKRGYGEQALAYVDEIANRSDLPADLKETLDLERSKSLRIAAGEAYDAQQRTARLAEAKRLAEKFFAEHPTHPAAGTLLLGEGDEALARGEQRLALARGARDKDVQAKALAESRAALTEARSRFEVALTRLKERIDSLGGQPSKPAQPAAGSNEQRDELALAWLEARSKCALCDYLVAQTYADAKDPERVRLLKQAGKGFDAVFQEYRGRQIGLLAHMWHGKTLEDLGNKESALDMYDEVLVVSPEGSDADPDQAPLFGQAELFRLRLLATSAQPKVVIDEGEQWLASHKKWQQTSPYQGIALEVARARLAAAEKLRQGSERTRLMRDCVITLSAIGKVDSDYRHEALLLRRETIAKMGTGAALSLQEALALADEAASEKNWTEADALYRQAFDLAHKANDAKSQETAKTRLAQALYRQAVDQYGARNMEKTLALCGELVRDNPENPLAEDASAVAIAAALALYGEAASDARQPARARLDRVANYALGHWPNKPVADDARMALAQVSLMQGDYPAALEQLGQVNVQSKRYSTALQIVGQVKWKEYLDAKKAANTNRVAEAARLREEAVTNLKSSLERQRASWQPRSEPMPAALFDTQLLLGEVYIEGQQWAEAAPLFEALFEFMKSAKPTSVDRSGQRALVGAVRAFLATGSAGQAADAALTLASISHDEEQPNSVLVEVAKLIGQETKKASPPSASAEQTTLGARPEPLRELHGRLIDALAPRTALTIPQLIYIGDACMSLDRGDKARGIYQRLLAMIDSDPAAKATAGAAVTGIRARLVGLLRSEGKLDEASQQITALIKEHPTALEPLMEKGYILQSLAERDSKRYDECISHWTDLRVRLGRSKTRPAEYYEVLYHAADCLVRQARNSSNKEKAAQAEQMLKSTLVLTPNLSGPDMVAKYEALLHQAASLRGESTTAARAAGNR